MSLDELVGGADDRRGVTSARTPAGRSSLTTLPAPTMDPSPIVTPGRTMVPAPRKTRDPMVTGATIAYPSARFSWRRGPGS